MSTPDTELIAFTIDTPDASAAARFYATLAGGEVTGEYPEYGYAQVVLGGHTVNFQTVQDYSAPQWPGQSHPQQFHLDFRVADLDAAVARAVELGGRQAADQPNAEMATVMIDPDGHPFCLCPPQG